MADVEIVVEAVDNASDEFKALVDSMEGLTKEIDDAVKSSDTFKKKQKETEDATKSLGGKLNATIKELTGFNIAQIGTAAAIGMTVKAVQAAIGDYSDYVEQIDKMSMATGLASEEMSRIAQVADDFRVNAGAMENALKMALQNGFNPSVESLAELADRIKGIHDPAKKAEELSKIFGRSWQDMLPFLDRGGAAIRAAADGIGEGLIVTEKAIETNRKYQESVDNLGDSWTGFKYSITREVLPVLAELLGANARSIDEMDKGATRVEVIANRQAEAMARLQAAQEAAAPKDITYWSNFIEAAGLGAEKVNGLSASMDLAAEAEERMKAKMGDLKDIVAGSYGQEIDNYNTKMGDLTVEHKNLAKQIDVLKSKPYLTAEQKQELDALRAKLWENRDAMSNLADAHEEAMKRMAYNMLMERAASDGLTENEVKNLTTIGQAWGLYDEKTAQVINAINENMDQLDTSNPSNLLNVLRAILGLPSSKTFDFIVNWSQNGIPAALGDVGLGGDAPINPVEDTDPGGSQDGRRRAAGGNARAGRTIMVGEFGPELFRPDVGGTITPTNSTLQKPEGDSVSYGPIYIQVLSTDPRGAAREIEGVLGDQARIAALSGTQYQGA